MPGQLRGRALRGKGSWISHGVSAALSVALLLLLVGCEKDEPRKSDAELGLSPQQADGRKIYDQSCGQCHEAYSSRGKNGPSMQGIFKRPYLSISGIPANDERVGDIIRNGRSKMPAYGRALNEQDIQNLLAYMHTL